MDQRPKFVEIKLTNFNHKTIPTIQSVSNYLPHQIQPHNHHSHSHNSNLATLVGSKLLNNGNLPSPSHYANPPHTTLGTQESAPLGKTKSHSHIPPKVRHRPHNQGTRKIPPCRRLNQRHASERLPASPIRRRENPCRKNRQWELVLVVLERRKEESRDYHG